MPNVKISQLPSATTANATDVFPLVVSPNDPTAATKQITLGNFTNALATPISSLPAGTPDSTDLMVFQDVATSQTQRCTVNTLAGVVSTAAFAALPDGVSTINSSDSLVFIDDPTGTKTAKTITISSFQTLFGGGGGGGPATTFSTLTGGVAGSTAVLTTAAGDATNSAAVLSITTGNATANNSTSRAGVINITGGKQTGYTGASTGGVWTWVASGGSATGNGSNWVLRAGPGGTTSGTGGQMVIAGGTPTSGRGGAVSITAAAGVGTNMGGGNVVINGGAATGTATAGSVNISSGTSTFSAAPNYSAVNITADSNKGVIKFGASYIDSYTTNTPYVTYGDWVVPTVYYNTGWSSPIDTRLGAPIYLLPASTIASLTVNLPTTSIDNTNTLGQGSSGSSFATNGDEGAIFEICSLTADITSVTFVAAGTTTIVNAPASLPRGKIYKAMYNHVDIATPRWIFFGG